MALSNRRNISLYEEAKAGLISLVQQTALVSVGFLVMLLLTGGNPPAFVVSLSVCLGIAFVAWSEKKRLTDPSASYIPVEEQISSRDTTLEKDGEDNDKSRLIQEILTKGVMRRDFNGANLRGANLSGADLMGANLRGTDLRGADLRGANLIRANLRGADLRGADLSDANLSGANLSSADLSDANLSDANLSDANLSSANLSSADLSGANLRGGKLIRADLRGTNLRGANLRGANLSGTIVAGALFTKTIGLTEDMKLDLKQRGAIFEDSPGDRSEVLIRR